MTFQLNRFIEVVHGLIGKDTIEPILTGLPAYKSLTTPVQRARWIHDLMDNLVNAAGVDQAKTVMTVCGQQCIGKSLLVKARKLKTEAQDLNELIDTLNESRIGGGKLVRKEDLIYASYDRCYCGSVSKTIQPISPIYCQCSCGWYQKLFETLFDKPVRVELVDSIIHGADACRFIIHTA